MDERCWSCGAQGWVEGIALPCPFCELGLDVLVANGTNLPDDIDAMRHEMRANEYFGKTR